MAPNLTRVLAAALVLLLAGCDLFFVPDPLKVPEQGITLTNVTIINPGQGRQPHYDITVKDGKILAINPGQLKADRNTPERFVLPGLIDMHTHMTMPLPGHDEWFALMNLLHGVTTVRDVGQVAGSVAKFQRAIAEGEVPGPRVFRCGPILDGDPPASHVATPLKTPAQARELAQELADEGVDCLKVYEHLSPDVLRAIQEVGRQRDIPVIGHVPHTVTLAQSGIVDVQHMSGVPNLPLQSQSQFELGGGGIQERFARFSAYAQLDTARMQEVAQLSVEKGITHTPTLVAIQQMLQFDDLERLMEPPIFQAVPSVYVDGMWKRAQAFAARTVDEEQWEINRRAADKVFQAVKVFHDHGVKLHAGTDAMIMFTPPGWALQQELHSLVRAGLTPEEAWVTASRNPGEFLRQPQLGTLAPGAPADLLVFRQDPTRDLSALETLETVIADGRAYSVADLQAQLALYQTHFSDPEYIESSQTMMSLVGKFLR